MLQSIKGFGKIKDHKFVDKCQQHCLAATSGSEIMLTVSQDFVLFQVSHDITGDKYAPEVYSISWLVIQVTGINHNGVRSTIHKLVFPVVINLLRKGTFYTGW